MNIKDMLVQQGTTGYGPVFWSHDPYAQPKASTTGYIDLSEPAGAVVLLVNEDWAEHPDQGRWGPDIHTFHKVCKVIPAPGGVTDDVVEKVEQAINDLSEAQRRAFYRRLVSA